jgi:putative FmdB family regulatory protein
MPIYEYRCRDCGKRTSQLILNLKSQPQLACRHCQSARLERVMSRFAAPKSDEARLESLADPSHFGDLDENDPKSMARFMKRMGQEMGEDLGDDVEQALEQPEGDGAESVPTDMD